VNATSPLILAVLICLQVAVVLLVAGLESVIQTYIQDEEWEDFDA
jgi:hypothetical protein